MESSVKVFTPQEVYDLKVSTTSTKLIKQIQSLVLARGSQKAAKNAKSDKSQGWWNAQTMDTSNIQTLGDIRTADEIMVSKRISLSEYCKALDATQNAAPEKHESRFMRMFNQIKSRNAPEDGTDAANAGNPAVKPACRSGSQSPLGSCKPPGLAASVGGEPRAENDFSAGCGESGRAGAACGRAPSAKAASTRSFDGVLYAEKGFGATRLRGPHGEVARGGANEFAPTQGFYDQISLPEGRSVASCKASGTESGTEGGKELEVEADLLLQKLFHSAGDLTVAKLNKIKNVLTMALADGHGIPRERQRLLVEKAIRKISSICRDFEAKEAAMENLAKLGLSHCGGIDERFLDDNRLTACAAKQTAALDACAIGARDAFCGVAEHVDFLADPDVSDLINKCVLAHVASPNAVAARYKLILGTISSYVESSRTAGKSAELIKAGLIKLLEAILRTKVREQ